MPTLPDYPGVFPIQLKSHGLPYGWPNTPEFEEKCLKYVFSHSFWPSFRKKFKNFDAFLQFLPHFDGWEELILMQNWQSPGFQFF